MEPRRARARQNGMRIVALVAASGLLISCGEPSISPKTQGAQEYEATATVLQKKNEKPMLCLGAVLTSYPPQCGDVPITNWDWAAVEQETDHPLVTWGHYHVRGTYDGKTFTLTADPTPPGKPDTEPNEPMDIPCEAPEGGWVAPEPARATHETMEATNVRAERLPGFAGLWIGYERDNPRESDDPTELVLNVAFTRDLAAREADLRETWGGSLCLVRYERSMKELERIRDDLMNGAAEELGLQMLGIGAAGDRNVVNLDVVVVYPDTEEKLADRYGEGVIEVSGGLRPVS